jgi:flagellar motor switch/type III secretory pathway protein FliN
MTDLISDIPDTIEAIEAMPKSEDMPSLIAPVSQRLDALFAISVTLELVLASLKMPVSQLMDIQAGTEIDLAHPAGAEVALVVNGSKIAFGHLFLIDPNSRRVGVRISRLAANGSDI